MYKTYQPKHKDIKREWHLIDAKGKVLGRLAGEVAKILIGKHKELYSQHMDMGDIVVVINSKDIMITGRKSEQKTYKSHSMYPGGFKEVAYKKIHNENPSRIIMHAVSGMLPENRLKDKRLRRLKLFTGSDHPYKKMFQNK